MSKADIIQRARVITDSLTDDVVKAVARRAPGKRGPITVNELPEDVTVRMVNTIQSAAPAATRKRLVQRLSKKQYALAGGGVIAGATLFNLDDLGFIDALLSLAPDAITEVVMDATSEDGGSNTNVGGAVQAIGDILYQHQMMAADYDAHDSMLPVDRSISSGLNLQFEQVNQLQALTQVYDMAITSLGSPEVLEAIIMLSNNTTVEDRVALLDMVKFRRGY